MQNKKELLKPKLDVVFHSLFREGNEDITKAIITAITKEKIKKIDISKNTHLFQKYPDKKLGIIDLKAILDNGTICDIEIQLANTQDTVKRFLDYWSIIYSSQLDKGEDYEKLNKVIGICILGYHFEKTKEIESMHTKWKIKETLTGKDIELTDVFELHILELPKLRNMLEKGYEDELAHWMLFLESPNEVGGKIMERNKEIKKAMAELEEISQDEELRRVAELEEKAIKDEKNKLRHATQDGFEKGLNQGLNQGLKQGIEQGIKQGIKQGLKDKSIEIARKLFQLGLSQQEIMEITGLTKEELENYTN